MSDYIKEDWGLIDYETARIKQRKLFELGIQQRKTGEDLGFKNHLIFCQHPHIFTLGRNASKENLLISEEALQAKSIQCVKTERGGNITYHGPGQLVVYPILNLKPLNLYIKDYVEKLEDVIIHTLANYNILGQRKESAPGVWVKTNKGLKKIAALGVRSSRFITMHGFALNANTNLDYFKMINPCGFDADTVCSIKSLNDKATNIEELKSLITKAFEDEFNLKQIS